MLLSIRPLFFFTATTGLIHWFYSQFVDRRFTDWGAFRTQDVQYGVGNVEGRVRDKVGMECSANLRGWQRLRESARVCESL